MGKLVLVFAFDDDGTSDELQAVLQDLADQTRSRVGDVDVQGYIAVREHADRILAVLKED